MHGYRVCRWATANYGGDCGRRGSRWREIDLGLYVRREEMLDLVGKGVRWIEIVLGLISIVLQDVCSDICTAFYLSRRPIINDILSVIGTLVV